MVSLNPSPIDSGFSMKNSESSTSSQPHTVDVVLGIETSCDETAASVVSQKGIASDVIWSQQVHQQYSGGSVSHREEVKNIVHTDHPFARPR